MGLHQELELFPEDPGALILLSFVSYKQGKFEEACRAAIQFDDVLTRLEKKRKLDKIDDILRANFPNGGLPDYILGLIEKKKENYSLAVERFILAQKRGYPALDCQLQIIGLELERGSWPEALAVCGEGADPEFPLPPEFYLAPGYAAEIYFLQGHAHDRMGQAEKAMCCFEKAANRKPFEPAILKSLGMSYLDQEAFGPAAVVFNKLVMLAPQDFQARLLLEQAELKRRTPRDEEKADLMREFMSKKDAAYRYIFNYDVKEVAARALVNSISLIKEGMLVDAARFLGQFVELYDLSPTLHYNLAQIYNSLNILGEAARHGIRAIELQPDYRDALDLMGNLCFKIRDLHKSVRYYEDAAKIDHHDPLAHYNLGCAYHELGDLMKAEASWRTAIQSEGLEIGRKVEEAKKAGDPLKVQVKVLVDPVSYSASVALGQLYARQGRREEALNSFYEGILLKPNSPQLYFEAGKLLFEGGETEKAKGYFDKYLALGGEEIKVKFVLSKK
jgi:tetratricopeptide (TPR) repeat protein